MKFRSTTAVVAVLAGSALAVGVGCGGSSSGGAPADDVEMGDAGSDAQGSDATDGDADGGSVEPGFCDPRAITDEVEAPEWVTDWVGVATYSYLLDIDEAARTVELADATGALLGRMTTVQVYGDSELPDGALVADLEAADGESVSAASWGGPLGDDGYRAQIRLRRGDAEMRLIADFSIAQCYGDSDGPVPCAAGLDATNENLVLPTCGLVTGPYLAQGYHPRLERLVYRAAIPAGAEAPPTGGRTSDGDAVLVVRDAYGDLPPADVASWLQYVELDGFVAAEATALLRAALLDPTWHIEVEKHVAYCTAEGFDGEVASLGGGLTQQQGKLSQGTSGAQSGSDWGGSSASSKSNTNAWGDPHLVTLDGYAYDFQAAGEFLLVEAPADADANVPALRIEARFEPIAGAPDTDLCRSVSVTSGVAVQFGDVRIGVRLDSPDTVWVDGQSYDVFSAADAVDGAVSYAYDGYQFEWRSDAGDSVVVRTGSKYQNISVELAETRRGTSQGLLGNFDGLVDNDFTLLSGAVLPLPLAADALYGTWGAEWRLVADSALLPYADGESNATFDDPVFPELGNITALEDPEVVDALQTCRDDGVVDPLTLVACAVDSVCLTTAVASLDARAAQPAAGGADEELSLVGPIRVAVGSEPPAAFADRPVCDGEARPVVSITREAVGPLAAEVSLDRDGSPGWVQSDGDLETATLAMGAEVRAYSLQLPAGEGGLFRARVRFSGPILGVALSEAALSATDPAGSAWSDVADRDLELSVDRIRISNDSRELELEWVGADDADQIRVWVEVTP